MKLGDAVKETALGKWDLKVGFSPLGTREELGGYHILSTQCVTDDLKGSCLSHSATCRQKGSLKEV